MDQPGEHAGCESSDAPAWQPPATRRKPRWYRLTADRLILALACLEGILYLSEHFRWFAFNERKGWTVLIAVASAILAMLMLLVLFTAGWLVRRPFQFSMRTLLLLPVVVALLCGWLRDEVQDARRQKAAAEALETLSGGSVKYRYCLVQLPGSAWLKDALGKDFFRDAVLADLTGGRLTDDDLKHVEVLAQLQQLYLGSNEVTGAGLIHLHSLTDLKKLCLNNTRMTDAGLVHLEALTQLQELDLDNTQLTNAGLEHLKGLTNLQSLRLSRTNVTEEGVRKLQRALPNCKIR